MHVLKSLHMVKIDPSLISKGGRQDIYTLCDVGLK